MVLLNEIIDENHYVESTAKLILSRIEIQILVSCIDTKKMQYCNTKTQLIEMLDKFSVDKPSILRAIKNKLYIYKT